MTEVLTLAQVKAQLRILSEDEDVYLNGLIAPAREAVENYTNRLLGEREVSIPFHTFNATRLHVWPIAPDAEVQISYFDPDGLPQTLTDARLILGPAYADVLPAQGSAWPQTNSPITVTITAGIPAEDVPTSLRHAMVMMISYWNDQREGAGAGMPPAVKILCDPYRVRMLA